MSSEYVKQVQSLPNIAECTHACYEDNEVRRLYGQSLTQLRKQKEFANFHYKPSPYNIRWVYGYNHKTGVINLNNAGSTSVLYAASNNGVVYNWITGEMRILQGHRHMVTCIAADSQGKWILTADSGHENVLTIWDSGTCFPQKTWFAPQGSVKLSKVALSGDAKYMLTLGYQDNRALICWWIWSLGYDEPHATKGVEIRKDGIIAMEFNPNNSTQFVLLTKKDIWIGVSGKRIILERGVMKETQDYDLKIRKPEKNISTDFGKLSCITFVSETSQLVVGTSHGAVLVYGYTIEYQKNADCSNYEKLKYIKVLYLEKHRINVIKNVDGLVVTGNNAGQIHFYDDQMKLLYWIHGFQVDSVTGLSFNISPRSYEVFDPKCNKICVCWENLEMEKNPETGEIREKLLKRKLQTDATKCGKTFLIRDFILCTQNQGIGFVDFISEKFVKILDYRSASTLSLTVHPEKPLFCVAYTDGTVELVNFVQHQLFIRIDLREHYRVVVPPREDAIKYDYEITIPQIAASCLQYSPSGMHLACGLDNGQLLFLDPTTADIITLRPFHDTNHTVQKISYSPDSMTLALADAYRTVCVYKYSCENSVWVFIGKHRAHYKGISSVFFADQKNSSGEYKLLSIGTDRIMVEYDISASTSECLEIFSLDRLDQTALPLAATFWPSPKELGAEKYRTDISIMLVANDEYKYKLVNYDTAMTLATYLGPRYDHPVNRVMLVTNSKNDKQQYLIFATKNVIGLQKMPLDGNPWKHAGLLGHPNEIIGMCFREDEGLLFNIGAKDSCVCQWATNYRSVDYTTSLGGVDLEPYYCLFEGGRSGWLFQEIRDLFYYIQIICQGTFSPVMRRVKDVIPIDSLPDLMRALGFFPSEYEVENLIVEAKYKVYNRAPDDEVGFEELVKLYINHRPAFGDSFTKIRNAFQTFASRDKDSYVMSRQDFVDTLGNYGERFENKLSWYLLSILSGHSFNDGMLNTDEDFSFLPQDLTLKALMSDILGIGDVDIMSEKLSLMESLGSMQTGSSVTMQIRKE